MFVEHLIPIGVGDLNLPNSVCVFDDGRIAVADGGNNRIIIYDQNGQELLFYGEAGFHPHNMREPIFVAVSPEQHLYISDWHNHRVLVFDKALKFSHTLFHLGPIHKPNTLKQKSFILELFIKHLLTDKVGAQYYFDLEGLKTQKEINSKYSFKLLISGLLYYLKNLNNLKSILFNRDISVRKVNGIAFAKNRMIITQKANRCVSAYKKEGLNLTLEQHITHYPDGTRFGRLCNMSRGLDGRYYICDQNNHRIAILDQNLTFDDIITFKPREGQPMAPFACVQIAPNMLAIAVSYYIEIQNLKTGARIWQSPKMGETHGVAWDARTQTLYYVDRSNSRIERFKVDF